MQSFDPRDNRTDDDERGNVSELRRIRRKRVQRFAALHPLPAVHRFLSRLRRAVVAASVPLPCFRLPRFAPQRAMVREDEPADQGHRDDDGVKEAVCAE